MISDEYHPDFGKVPESKGVPLSFRLSVAIGIIIIFAIGGSVVLTAGYGHHWPYLSNLRINLPAPK